MIHLWYSFCLKVLRLLQKQWKWMRMNFIILRKMRCSCLYKELRFTGPMFKGWMQHYPLDKLLYPLDKYHQNLFSFPAGSAIHPLSHLTPDIHDFWTSLTKQELIKESSGFSTIIAGILDECWECELQTKQYFQLLLNYWSKTDSDEWECVYRNISSKLSTVLFLSLSYGESFLFCFAALISCCYWKKNYCQ